MESVIVAALALIGTLAGTYFSNRKGTALIAYRLEELEKRMYQVEERTELQEEKIKVANHRIEDLERKAEE